MPWVRASRSALARSGSMEECSSYASRAACGRTSSRSLPKRCALACANTASTRIRSASASARFLSSSARRNDASRAAFPPSGRFPRSSRGCSRASKTKDSARRSGAPPLPTSRGNRWCALLRRRMSPERGEALEPLDAQKKELLGRTERRLSFAKVRHVPAQAGQIDRADLAKRAVKLVDHRRRAGAPLRVVKLDHVVGPGAFGRGRGELGCEAGRHIDERWRWMPAHAACFDHLV